MTLPQWFTRPNDVMTVEDIREMLEYEKSMRDIIKREYEVSTGEDAERLYVDLANAEMRVAQLEDSL